MDTNKMCFKKNKKSCIHAKAELKLHKMYIT